MFVSNGTPLAGKKQSPSKGHWNNATLIKLLARAEQKLGIKKVPNSCFPPPAYYAARSDLLMPRHGKSQRIGIQWL